MASTEPIRDEHHVQRFILYYLDKGELRNYLLIVMGIFTALRISDLLTLLWDQVYDIKNKRAKNKIVIKEKKTGKTSTIALNINIINAVKMCKHIIEKGKPIFENKNTGKPISRVQAYRIIREAAENLNIPTRVACHSLRKTFGYHAWKKGVSPVVIMDIYNHSSFEVTRRYLGVTQDDKDEVFMGLVFRE